MRHLTFEQIFDLPQLSLSHLGSLLPPSPGIYFVLQHTPCKQIVYIGKAKNLQQRWRNHHRKRDLLLLEALGVSLSLAYTPGIVSYDDVMLYSDEAFLIQKFNPLLNNWSTPRGAVLEPVETAIEQSVGHHLLATAKKGDAENAVAVEQEESTESNNEQLDVYKWEDWELEYYRAYSEDRKREEASDHDSAYWEGITDLDYQRAMAARMKKSQCWENYPFSVWSN